MITCNANVSRPQTGTRVNSVLAKTDSAAIHHHSNQSIGGQGGRGGGGGVQGQGGAGGTGEGPRVHITAHNVTNMHPSPAVVQASQVLNHCPPPSKNFQGRQAILNEMHCFFTENTGVEHVYVLYGLGGAGKTQIALKVIADSTRFTDRLLVDASSTERIQAGLKNIATVKASGESWQDGLGWLLGKHQPWLLFFDNADDPEVDLNSFVPRCNHGNIIITSRNQGLKGYGAHALVSDMEEQDAIVLLLKSATHIGSPTNNQLAAELVQELWYLPLAIAQAGAFILQSEDLSSYLALFRKNRVNLLSEKPAQSYDGYSLSVFTTWHISFKKLSQPAAMLLQLCSFLHWDGISEDIFSGASRNLQQALEFLSHFVGPSGEWNKFDFVKVTNEIKAYSLMNFNAEKKSFSIHPLVHEWSRTTLADLDSTHLCVIDILGMCIVGTPTEDRPLASLKLVSHVDSLMQAVPEEISRFGGEYGYIYYCAGQYTKAKKLEMNKLEKTREILGDDHPDTLTAMHNLAGTYHSLGQFEDTEWLELVVLEKRRKILGAEHLHTLAAMNNLAATYCSLGRFEDAEKLQLVVLEKRRKILGDEHPETLNAMTQLAHTYHSLGQFEDAEQVEQVELVELVVLEKRRKIFSDEHPEALAAMNNLADTYHSLGQFEDAEQLQLVVLEKRRKILRNEHPDTLTSL
ncbi:P-loop containing nucleoside triphosphate hydrolase protein [Mycena galopus ATCC 62051]|nr:P-loop containing nucleoside triphosphate hydrolase protein [Mycena galopus ATCC 62051]